MPGYGIAKKDAGMMEWARLSNRLARAHNYWIITTRPDGRPHAAPVWGIWMDEVFYFSTGARSIKGHNLARNRSLVVHLESGDDVVILEGTAERVKDRGRLLKINRVYGAKYKIYPLGKSGKGNYSVRFSRCRCESRFAGSKEILSRVRPVGCFRR